MPDDKFGESPSPALIEYMQKTMKNFRVYSQARSLNLLVDDESTVIEEEGRGKSHKFLIKEFPKPILNKSYH